MDDLIIVGDRVLIEPRKGEDMTEAGLYLPATATERDRVRIGRVVKVGPGYLFANPEYSEGEAWTRAKAAVRYLPLQAKPGDLAFFLRKEAIEISYRKKSYLIVQHAAIVALVRHSPEGMLDEFEDMMSN